VKQLGMRIDIWIHMCCCCCCCCCCLPAETEMVEWISALEGAIAKPEMHVLTCCCGCFSCLQRLRWWSGSARWRAPLPRL
jgi:hypothetical protein